MIQEVTLNPADIFYLCLQKAICKPRHNITTGAKKQMKSDLGEILTDLKVNGS